MLARPSDFDVDERIGGHQPREVAGRQVLFTLGQASFCFCSQMFRGAAVRCDLLEGDVNYPEVMKALREVGYDGPCVAEFFGLEPEGLGKVSKAMDRILAL